MNGDGKMTVKDLKLVLESVPDGAPVLVKTDFEFGYYSEANVVGHQRVKLESGGGFDKTRGYWTHPEMVGFVIESV